MKNEFLKRFLSSILIVPGSFFFILAGPFYFAIMLYFFYILSYLEWEKVAKNKNYFLAGLIFLKVSFLLTYVLREKFGVDFLIFTILICVSTDIGGYFFGKILQGPKLIKISPNKTYAGLIGGYLLAFIAAYFYLQHIGFFALNNLDINVKNGIFITFFISSVSQMGDIIISYFKRLSKLKNTGNIIPGHGGILDRIDGMIFAIPSITIILLFLK